MTTLPQALEGSRCILHIDLDCFYCQVEQVRLGISSEVPAAVQQWHSLIAVNYPARKAGVQRHCTVNDAKELCPDIQFLHVPTYAAGEKEPKYRENPDRQTQKVSLDPYRAASKKIFQIFHKHCDKLQKIGLDEAFMDVTTTINKRLENFIDQNPQMLEKVNDEECGTKLDWNKVGYVLESKEEEERKKAELYWSKTTWKDLQLYIGAELAAEIRKEIFDTLGYTCSAGIAHYKTVAKLCSSKNKPNKQTVLRLTAVSNFMETVPFTKIRNLGGKLGSEIESELSVDKASDLWPYSIQDLQKKFGPSTGLYLHNICRGIDNEEIIPAKAPKSIMASKSFNPVVENMQDMDKWFSILAIELHNRLMLNYEEYNTWPKSFSLHYASIPYFSFRSKVIGHINRNDIKDTEQVARRLEKVFKSLTGNLPCSGIQFHASNLEKGSSQSRSIKNFFTKTTIDAATNPQNDTQSESTQSESTQSESTRSESTRSESTRSESTRSESTRSESTRSESTRSDKKKGLYSFWETTTDTCTWTCDKCNKPVPLKDVDEHTDFHFALEFQEQDNPSSNVRKRKIEDRDNNKRKKTFFS